MEQTSTTFAPAADAPGPPSPSSLDSAGLGFSASLAALPDAFRRVRAEQPHWISLGVPLLILAVYVYVVAWGEWFNPASALWFQPFVPFAVAYAIWRDRFHVQAAYTELTDAFVEGSLRKRGHLIVPFLGCALIVLGALMMLPTLSVVGFVALLVGGIYYLYGPKILLVLGQPLFYLIFMVPPWLTVVAALTQLSQFISRLVVGQVFQVFLNGVHSTGLTVTLPNYTLEITPAASGFSVLAPVLVLTAFLALFKRLHLSWTGILLIVAWAISSALNVVRLTTAGVIGNNGNPDWATTLRDANPLIQILQAALAFYLTYLVTKLIFRPAPRRRTEFEEDLAWSARMQADSSHDSYDDEDEDDEDEDDDDEDEDDE